MLFVLTFEIRGTQGELFKEEGDNGGQVEDPYFISFHPFLFRRMAIGVPRGLLLMAPTTNLIRF